MPDAKSEVQIVISGSAVGLSEALKQAQAGLSALGGSAAKAGAEAGEHLAAGEHKAASEATILGERARVAAEMVGLLGAESSEQILKIEGLNHAFGEAQHAFSGFGGALAATAGSFALFKGLDFMKESVEEAEQGEASWARLTAAYKDNAEGLEQVKHSIEEQQPTWEKLGLTQAQVAEMAAKAAGMGLDPTKLLGDPAALADTAKVLGTDIPTALEDIARPRGAQQVLGRLGLSPVQIREAIARMRDMNAQQRALFLEQQVEQSRFAGQGLAAAGTAQGTFLAFHTAMADLREEVGNALLPALTDLAAAMTGLLQGAEKAAQPFGGLGTVLKTLLIPMMGLGLLLFTNLRGMMTRLVDLLLGRLVGAFSQTAEAMAEADGEARTLADDLGSIPALVATTATFVPDAAKEAWIANIASIPRGPIVTTGEFVPGTITEPTPAPVEVPVRYVSDLKFAGIPTALVADDKALAQQAQRIRTLAAADLAKGGPLPVKVRPQWVSNAASGLKTGLAVGVAAAFTDAIFSSVTIKHATFPAQTPPSSPPPSPSPGGGGVARTVTVSGTANTYVTNFGAMGEATVNKLPHPLPVTLHGTHGPQPVTLANVPTVKLDRTTPIQGTLVLPSRITMHAQQSGPWTVSLSPDAFARFGQMIGEIAIGVMIGNLLQGLLDKIPFGKIIDVLKGLFRGKGGKGPGGAEEPDLPLLPQWSQSTAQDMVDDLLKGQGVPPERSLVPVPAPRTPLAGPTSTFLVTGIVNAFKAINWSAALSAAGFAAKIAGAIGGFFLAAFAMLGKGLGALGGPQSATITSGPLAAQLVILGLKIVQGIASGVGKAAKALGDIGGTIINAIVDGIKSHWPSFLFWPFGGSGPGKGKIYAGGSYQEQYIPYKGQAAPKAPGGWQYILEQHKSDHKMWYDLVQKAASGGSGAGKFGGLARMDPALLAQAGALIGASAAGGTAQATAHHTYNATFNIHGATDANAVARQVNRAFSEFVQGARAQRRLHG